MTFATFADADITLQNDRISPDDAIRQQRAAAEILRRFERQPGVVLADEVGMGKTFVAIAAAMSILIARDDEGPIVVMSPPSLRHKWPKDWKVFVDKCLHQGQKERFRARSADTGIEFLKLLDDSPDRRAHVIFLTHGAMHRAMSDGFARLAVIKRAFKGRSSLSHQREAFARWAGTILRLELIERRAKGLLGDLLDRPYANWLKTIHRADLRLGEQIVDDPVPQHLVNVLEDMSSREFDTIVEALRDLPLRDSANITDRLATVRRELAAEMDKVWRNALVRAHFRSPLLVLDEAHHVKNPATRLASLFMTPESEADSQLAAAGGPLAGRFERMLFLTATPFQLGHAELIRVLDRFDGICWDGPQPPVLGRDEFKRERLALGRVLDDAQSAALRLDRAWSRLSQEHVGDLLSPDDLERWWNATRQTTGEGIVAQVVGQVAHTRDAMQAAEKMLAPWVLRHVRQVHLPGAPDVRRRNVLPGAAILGGSHHQGLDITPEVLLPFLIAGRAQGLVAASGKGRALFAEGLASSFEAYLETRRGNDGVDEDGDLAALEASPELDWYLERLQHALPRDNQHARSEHPKVRATAERAVAFWERGEKVLVFCHYRATGRALRQHISALMHQKILALGQQKLPGRTVEEVDRTLNEVGDQFFDDDRLKATVIDWLEEVVRPFAFSADHKEMVVEAIRRFLRTPSFLVRYLPIDASDLAGGFRASLDASYGHESLRSRIEGFCRFLAERCIDDERDEFLNALKTVQTGTHFGRDVRAAFDPGEGRIDDESAVLLPNVRLANGEVRHETRRRLLLTFNTPLFPEVLIASSVLAEGVDLHLHCRHVIHHDLCWNPSTLEQRSGRVDRIGCLAERILQPIHLYLPYIAATQDEKMFRVVRDRERWFQIVMGETYEVDEAATDARAARIPLPESIQRQLAMRLHP